MRRILFVLLCGVLLVGFGAGCGGHGKKSANSGRDMPKPAETP